MKAIQFDYFYGQESQQFAFFRIPKVLVKDKKYKRMSSDAKILYGLMLDRMELSARNNWFDESNRCYIFYTAETIAEDLDCCVRSARTLIAELKKIELIEVKRQGQGKPAKIYVKKFVSTAPLDVQKSALLEVQNPAPLDVQNLHPNKTNSLCIHATREENLNFENNNALLKDLPLTENPVVADTGQTQKVTSSEPSCENPTADASDACLQGKQGLSAGETEFVKPSFDEVKAYAAEKGLLVDPFSFYEYYENKGWKHRKGKHAGQFVRNWKNTMLMWHKADLNKQGAQTGAVVTQAGRVLTVEEQNRLCALKKTLDIFDEENHPQEHAELLQEIEELEGRCA